ncbi:hypothetical protein ACR6C2_38240 [Streptomyces sp. INA 01156]
MEKLSHADASLGWLVRAVVSETAAAATYLGDEAVAELFTQNTFPLVAGQSTAFTGQAVREDGGYRVSGVWQFAAGCPWPRTSISRSPSRRRVSGWSAWFPAPPCGSATTGTCSGCGRRRASTTRPRTCWSRTPTSSAPARSTPGGAVPCTA